MPQPLGRTQVHIAVLLATGMSQSEAARRLGLTRQRIKTQPLAPNPSARSNDRTMIGPVAFLVLISDAKAPPARAGASFGVTAADASLVWSTGGAFAPALAENDTLAEVTSSGLEIRSTG